MIDFQDCLTAYNQNGVSFEYPDIWELKEDCDGDDIVLTVSCDESCFWTLRLLGSCPPPPEVIESCVSAYTEEYDDVEVTSPDAKLSGLPAVCRELEFFCVDLPVTVCLSSIRSRDFTALVWWQASAQDLATARPMIDHISRSVQFEL